MARALGASVAASGGKEIGFAPLLLTDDGQRSPCRPAGHSGTALAR
jgi:GMP synthase (glutamine-hydrolysing)